MTTIKILKTYHGGEQTARELGLHIRACSVYAPEESFLTLENARTGEKKWKDFLQSKRSIKQVRRILEAKYGTDEMGIFVVIRAERLYREKKPVIYLERWDPKKVEEFRTANNKAEGLYVKGLVQIFKGDELQGLDTYVTGVRIINDVTDQRDEHIARNLENVDDLVQDVYPSLKDTPIKLCVEIGGGHNLEKYTDLPIETVDLTDKVDRICMIGQQIRELVRESTVDTDRLMYLLRQLANFDVSRIGK